MSKELIDYAIHKFTNSVGRVVFMHDAFTLAKELGSQSQIDRKVQAWKEAFEFLDIGRKIYDERK